MTQTLKLPAVSIGIPVALEVRAADQADPFRLTTRSTNLVSYVDDLVFYEDDIVEY